jgi:leucyl/phenylalanyl-tRNA--protein transferase
MVEEGYRLGVFPMGELGRRIITWHCPDPRAIIPLDAFHVTRSLARTLHRGQFEVTYDRDFAGVMAGCADRPDTWITADVQRVYGDLHRIGKAHSVEVWIEGRLAGGVYGVHLGGAFFAESKFHRVADMSKVALVHLARRLTERGFRLLEVQYWTPHLDQFGAMEISHKKYMELLRMAVQMECIW